MALNRRLIDIADRNINAGFDLATSLCRAKNLAEAMELQAAYWQKQLVMAEAKAIISAGSAYARVTIFPVLREAPISYRATSRIGSLRLADDGVRAGLHSRRAQNAA